MGISWKRCLKSRRRNWQPTLPRSKKNRQRSRKELRRQFSKVIQKLLMAQKQKVVRMTEMGAGGLRRTIMQPRYSKNRPSIERNKRLLPSLKRIRTSRIGQTRRTRPRKGKRKLRPRQQRGKESLDLNEGFPTFPT